MSFFEQFRYCLYIDLSGAHSNVSHIGGECRQSGVNIPAIAIPGQKPMNREGMAQIMNPRPWFFVIPNTAVFQKNTKGLVDSAMV